MKMRTGFVELILLKSQSILILSKNAFQSIIQKLYYQLIFLKLVFQTTQFWLVFLSKNVMRWNAKINHYHRAAGHPTGRNLVRLFRDAGLLQWKIRMAMDFKCPACESLKRGGSSSGNLPPAATHPLPAA